MINKKMPTDSCLDERADVLFRNLKRVRKMQRSSNGKFRVIGVDKFDGEDWIHGEYESAEQAITEARKQTKEAMKYATDNSIATVYYAYSPDGKYLGGDTWARE